MVNTVWVNADQVRKLHPLADHMTKLNNFTKEENRDFSALRFSLQLMLEQALTNFIVCDFKKNTYRSCINELASCSGY